MRKIGYFLAASMCAYILTACTPPAANTAANANTNANSNANANAAKPVAAAPTADTLLALDKQANEAYFKGDATYFQTFLSDKFAMVDHGKRFTKAEVTKELAGVKCDVKEGWKLEDPQMVMVDADTYVLSYKGTVDGTCTMDGKTEKVPSPVRAATVFVRNGDKWQGAFHGENPIVDPKAPPPPPAKTAAKKEEPKKDEKKGDKAMANSNANAAPAAPAGPTKSANTDALVAIEKSGWEAWKAKDAKKLEDLMGPNVAILSGDGSWMGKKADIVKFWTEMPCENVKNVDVKDGFGTALSPTVEMLTFKGWADGTCFGQKNGTQDSMSIYVKDGAAWKLAFAYSAAGM